MKFGKFALALVLESALAISCRTKNAVVQAAIPSYAEAVDSTEEDLPYENFRYESEDLAFDIDSSNISEFRRSNDTLYISVFPPNGIIEEDRPLRMLRPALCEDDYILQFRQNRPFIDSMGPDPILDDMLYTAPADTLRFDDRLQGFRIRPYTEDENSEFRDFDTIAFVKSYKKAVGDVLNADFAPGIAKQALYEEYLRNDESMRDALERLGFEIHQVILVLRRKNGKGFTLVFQYGHFG